MPPRCPAQMSGAADWHFTTKDSDRPRAAAGSGIDSPAQLRSPDVQPVRRDARGRLAVAEEDPEQPGIGAIVGPVFAAIRQAFYLPGVAEPPEHLPPRPFLDDAEEGEVGRLRIDGPGALGVGQR